MDNKPSAGPPSETHEEIVRRIGDFSVAVFAIGEGHPLKLGGSGTLVAVADSHYLLTAAHVWEKVLKDSEEIAITLQEDQDHSFGIRTDAITTATVGPELPEEWGPDLCFLRVPPDFVRRIEAYRTFYNLSKRKEDGLSSAPDVDEGWWVLMGAPAATGHFTPNHASLEITGYFTVVERLHQRGDFDYVDLLSLA